MTFIDRKDRPVMKFSLSDSTLMIKGLALPTLVYGDGTIALSPKAEKAKTLLLLVLPHGMEAPKTDIAPIHPRIPRASDRFVFVDRTEGRRMEEDREGRERAR